jgi:hypothetical protein
MRLSHPADWLPDQAGIETRWFPCSLLFARWSRSPTMSQRPSHRYAVDLPCDLHGLLLDAFREVLAASANSETHRVRPESARFRVGVKVEGRNNAGSSRTPLHHARRTRTIWQCWHVPALSGLLPSDPTSPGPDCPQLHPAATTTRRCRSSTSTRTSAPHGATRILDTPQDADIACLDNADGQCPSGGFRPPTSRAASILCGVRRVEHDDVCLCRSASATSNSGGRATACGDVILRRYLVRPSSWHRDGLIRPRR